MKEPPMAPENDFGPRQETCVCGQQIQWYPSVSREAVVVLFHKNFSFSHRFEFHVPPGGLVEFECVRCLEPLSVRASRCTLSLIHISEPTRLGMISYAVFCLKKKKK